LEASLPRTTVVFYREASGEAPVLDWMRRLKDADPRGYAKCVARIQRLSEMGHELRRPEADYLRDGIRELRIRSGRVNYRILYSYDGRDLAVLAHALRKEGKIDSRDLRRALRRMTSFKQDPGSHTLNVELD
jgi:phage-related protein